jgi:hypothetical protein
MISMTVLSAWTDKSAGIIDRFRRCHMTLEQLRIFVGVAEREHMTRGAEALNITQSAASGAIATIEARYGVPLFHRIGRGIQLTQAGQTFLGEARACWAVLPMPRRYWPISPG